MHTFLDTLMNLILPILLMAPLAVATLIFYVRVLGLRSFSKMTSFDFVTTVASGSLLANAATASDWANYSQSIFAIGALFFVQFAIAKARINFPAFRAVTSNEPVVLFSKGSFDEEALARTLVAKEDVWAKIREANALQVDLIHAVVLETTGDISVLHGSQVDSSVMTGVRRTN